MASNNNSERKSDVVSLVVLSGFFGGGKTTLLRHILTHRHGRRIAVLVNDVNEINIDSKLVAKAVDQGQDKKDWSMKVLANGESKIAKIAKIANNS